MFKRRRFFPVQLSLFRRPAIGADGRAQHHQSILELTSRTWSPPILLGSSAASTRVINCLPSNV